MARLTTLTQETTIRQISERIYGTLSAKDRTRVENALLEANPHLAEPNAFAPGTVVRVPALTGLKARSAAGTQEPVGELRDAVAASVTDYRAALSKHVDAAAAELDAQTELLKDRAVAAALKRAGASALTKQVTDSLRERAKSLTEYRKRQDAVFKRISADLQRLDEG